MQYKINRRIKYKIFTFGCQMNESDSQRIAAILERKSYSSASINEADLIVVNMCSVRQSAVDRVFGLIEKFKKLKVKNPKLQTVLTGCILAKDRLKFRQGFDRIMRFPDLLKYKPNPSTNSGRVFVPISNGCNNLCTYCAVPLTRGALKCRSHKEILKEIKAIARKNPKEIWLLGQNVNHYYSPEDPSINFIKLLKMVYEVPGDFKIFFMSPHPKNFSDKLINILADCPKFGRYLNLPVQSGDDKILKKMGRNYTAAAYKKLVEKIRGKMPDINLSTDAIVGFPGETKKQFGNTVKLFKEIKFDNAYISKYSPRSGTAAFKLKNNIPLTEKKRREKCLRNLLLS